MANSLSIVGVCSANVMRSTVFEAVLKSELQGTADLCRNVMFGGYKIAYNHSSGTYDGINVTSAGTNVSKILSNTSSLEIQLRVLKAGLEYGLVRDEIKKEVGKVVELGDDQAHVDGIRAFYGEIKPLVHGHNIALRNQALEEVGIKNFPTHYTPFTPEPSIDYIIAMSKKEEEEISKEYTGKEIARPIITTYGRLLMINDLEDDIGGGIGNARSIVSYFKETVELAIRIINAQMHMKSTQEGHHV